jgi:hypothetical protein
MGKRQRRQPAFAETLSPGDARLPRMGHGCDREVKPVWRVHRMDFGGPWCWRRMDHPTLDRVHSRLAAFESMTFGEIEGKKHHQIPVEQLGGAAQSRLHQLGLDDYDALLSLRITRAERVWGVKTVAGVDLLWWDPDHTVYPMNITDN